MRWILHSYRGSIRNLEWLQTNTSEPGFQYMTEILSALPTNNERRREWAGRE